MFLPRGAGNFSRRFVVLALYPFERLHVVYTVTSKACMVMWTLSAAYRGDCAYILT